ncbi:transcription factor 7-like 1 [Austrofundulus limnaeus]|uniref:Transcription factor 7-like 1 n=1 Tax=Austrofundulus limnaeus TaxID=52670 RepID=A0A2I4AJM2_AUSLI|nr:PREDICTED: transcription factor 7-like 1 [Austrofundulus limnaeus]
MITPIAVNGPMQHVILPVVAPYMGTGNGEMLHQVHPAAAPLNARRSVKNPRKTNVKKSLNAFRLFSKKQKLKGMAELQDKISQTMDGTLRKKWKSLSDEDKAEYYRQAKREKDLYEQRCAELSAQRCSQRTPTSSLYKKWKEAREKQLPFW